MEKGKCPECDAVIGHLDFESEVTQWGHEWGTCDIHGDNQDWGDSEFNDGETNGTIYKCPECEREIDFEDIKSIDEIEEEEPVELNEDGEPIKQAEEPKTLFTSSTGTQPFPNYTSQNRQSVESLVCHECGHRANPIDANELSVLCIKCGAELIKENAETISFGGNKEE